MDGSSEHLVVIGDRRPIVGASLASLLNRHGYVAMATPQPDIAIKEASIIGANLAIIDIDQPTEPTLATLVDARASGYSVPVLAVADNLDRHVRRKALLAGARAMVARSLPTETFLVAVERLCHGDSVLPDLDEPTERDQPGPARPWLELTCREVEILRGLATGSSTSELAEQFGLSSATVRTYVQRVLMKVGVHSRAAAVAAAAQAGLLRSGPPGAGPPGRATAFAGRSFGAGPRGVAS